MRPLRGRFCFGDIILQTLDSDGALFKFAEIFSKTLKESNAYRNRELYFTHDPGGVACTISPVSSKYQSTYQSAAPEYR